MYPTSSQKAFQLILFQSQCVRVCLCVRHVMREDTNECMKKAANNNNWQKQNGKFFNKFQIQWKFHIFYHEVLRAWVCVCAPAHLPPSLPLHTVQSRAAYFVQVVCILCNSTKKSLTQFRHLLATTHASSGTSTDAGILACDKKVRENVLHHTKRRHTWRESARGGWRREQR